MRRIPVYQPDLSGNEKKYVDDCIDSTWISSKGKYVSEFEKLFSSYIGTKYAISVNNGTAALHLALMMAGINKEDEVIVPALTYIATANAVTYVGAKAVFVDSDEETWQINPELIFLVSVILVIKP
jgi:perosamine synthetase